MKQATSKAEQLEFASVALDRLGIDHRPEDLTHVDGKIIGTEVGSGLYVQIGTRPSGKEVPLFSSSESSPPGTNLNGQLRNEQVILGSFRRTGYKKSKLASHVSRLEVVSAPSQFNLVQVALGHLPGVHVFKSQKQPGEGSIKLLPWMKGISRKTALSADPITSWREALHDLGLATTSHGLGWLHASRAMCHSIANNAERLIDLYGDDISLPAESRPAEVENFADSLEHIDLSFTVPIFREVSETGLSAEKLEYAYTDERLRRIGKKLDPKTTQVDNSTYKKLENLGIITPRITTETARAKAYSDAVADLTAHVAANLLRADALWARQHSTYIQQQVRKAALQNILEMASAA